MEILIHGMFVYVFILSLSFEEGYKTGFSDLLSVSSVIKFWFLSISCSPDPMLWLILRVKKDDRGFFLNPILSLLFDKAVINPVDRNLWRLITMS